ncbi:MAG: adenosylmethionine--8-amino-7-oxononanoate transaminase [Vulcanimicrobiaceae bacterium]
MSSHLWLPFTQMSDFDARERTFVAGAGSHLTDARGRTLFDAISSVWVTIHGHGHPAIVEAIARQAARLDHATALGASNPVAEELAERLAALAGLDYAFFASDGASAVEAALKMALQYWRRVGEPQRTTFAHLRASYHGDTAAAMSVSDIAIFKREFGAVCFESVTSDDLGLLHARDDIAAIVVEPRVQAAAGMRLVRDDAYAPLRRSARGDAHAAPLLVIDEIATGFGRTGTMFAYESLGIAPDLLCVGKGITGGTLALSATLATARVYDAFLGRASDLRHFFHGHSYAANPIACAAALASLDLFASEATLAHVARLDAHLGETLRAFDGHPRVREVRRAGLMCGIELAPPAGWDAAGSYGRHVARGLYDRGHFTRPIGETIQLVPPLCARPSELDSFVTELTRVLAA